MNFLCSSCGACCRLAGLLNGAKHGLPISKDGSCLHLKDNKCSIYENRPDICRVSKMTGNKNNVSRKEYYIEATKNCHKLIDLFNLDKKYKIDIEEYN